MLNFVFKPLATVVVIVHALQRGRDAPLVGRSVLSGLRLSLCGDGALLWPKEGFCPAW